ncbi:hypothetical protein MOVI109754_22645 [Moritella viscosa]
MSNCSKPLWGNFELALLANSFVDINGLEIMHQ